MKATTTANVWLATVKRFTSIDYPAQVQSVLLSPINGVACAFGNNRQPSCLCWELEAIVLQSLMRVSLQGAKRDILLKMLGNSKRLAFVRVIALG